MGVIKDVIKKADQTPGVTAEVKETLNLLYELSKQKADLFEEQIAKNLRNAGTTENPTIPITVKLGSHQEIRVTTANTPDKDITDGISTALKSVLTGSKDGIINGLTSLIDTSLRVILGAGEGEEREEHTYYVATEGLAIVRLDLIYWSRHITASSITKYAEKSVVCTAVKSSVDLSKIDFNAFLASYQAQLVRCKFSDEQLQEELINAKKIYKLMTEDTNAALFRVTNISDTVNQDAINSNANNGDIMKCKIADFGVISSNVNNVSGVWPAKAV